MKMSKASTSEPILVRAKFTFKGKNNDELCFQKNDVITITQKLDGGWWEGTLNEKTGWFPKNYVIELREGERHLRSKSPAGLKNGELSLQPSQSNKTVYRNMVLKDLFESEQAHVKELQTLFNEVLLPLRQDSVLERDEYDQLVGNIEQIIQHQIGMLKILEIHLTKPSLEQEVGSEFMKTAATLKTLLKIYCENHPLAVEILRKRRTELERYVKSRKTTMKALISGLSKPFRHMDRYPTTLQELERNMEESHPDRGNTQRAVSVYRDLSRFCSSVRKQKEMQLELLSGLIQDWEGTPLQTLGDVCQIGSAGFQLSPSEERKELSMVLFPSVLLLLEVAQKLSAYVFRKKISLSGLRIRKLEKSQIGAFLLEFYGEPIGGAGGLTTNFATNEELMKWIEAFQAIEGVHLDESCTTISPSEPSTYNTVQGSLSPSIKPQVSQLPSPGHAELIKKSTTMPARLNHDLQMIEPDPLNSPVSPVVSPRKLNQPKLWTGYSLRPHPPPRGHFVVDPEKNSFKMRKKSGTTDQEDAQILKVVEAYCTSAMTQKVSGVTNEVPQVLVPEDEKLIIEEIIDDEVVFQEKSLVDTVYALKDQVGSLQKELRNLTRTVEKEQRARKRLEEILRRSGSFNPQSSGKSTDENSSTKTN